MPKQYTRRAAVFVIGPSIAYIPLTQGQYALVDSEDASSLQKYLWYAKWNGATRSFYALREENRTSGAVLRIFMHAAILPIGTGLTVDHRVAGRSLDNRKANLRPATKAQQAMNRRLRSDNKTGHKGVSYSRSENRYRVTVGTRRIGRFVTIQEAVAAYRREASRQFGEFFCIGEREVA